MKQEHITVIDQMGNEVSFNYPPQRIISLVPSQTELLADLGLEDRVVGITKFCELPAKWQVEKTKVGGTKKINFDAIEKLKPDLIIGNKEENEKKEIEKLAETYPVWMSDITSMEDALAMIDSISDLTDRASKGRLIIERIKEGFQKLPVFKSRVLYLIWRKPWMAAGSETFINTLISKLGLTNVLGDIPRYPELTAAEIQTLNPDTILLSSEPFPFAEKHIAELKVIVPKANVMLVDGQFFSWYGSRLIHVPDYFSQLKL